MVIERGQKKKVQNWRPDIHWWVAYHMASNTCYIVAWTFPHLQHPLLPIKLHLSFSNPISFMDLLFWPIYKYYTFNIFYNLCPSIMETIILWKYDELKFKNRYSFFKWMIVVCSSCFVVMIKEKNNLVCGFFNSEWHCLYFFLIFLLN